MRVPFGWLEDYVASLPAPEEVAERLTMAGLEVESVSRPDPRLVDHLIVAQVREISRHPNADRLSICIVDDGTEERRIVCGATNMKVDDYVVLARPGAVLPGGVRIKESRIRGERSQGMLCSAAELGLEAESDGILVLDADLSAGESAARLLGLDQVCLDIAVTPNRGDCLSMRGIAREVSAVCRLELREAFFARPEPTEGGSSIEVRIEDPSLCPLYFGQLVREAELCPSPAWLRARLSAAGLRPINNVVDITNYVLLDRGQPLHAFDAERLSGSEIRVAPVGEPTEIETLDGKTRMLEPGDLAIWDADGPIAIAGVMGGLRTAVGSATRSLFLESAIFLGARVRATSRRLGLVSESSYRFERGVDPEAVSVALLDAARMIEELAGARPDGGLAQSGPGLPEPARVHLRLGRVAALLGVTVGADEARETIRRLGGTIVAETDSEFEIRAPSHRHDLAREVDWVEEIARLEGYDSIPVLPPIVVAQEATWPPRYRLREQVRTQLLALGLTETVALAFASAEENERFPGLDPAAAAIRLRNPLRSEAAELRRSLLGGLFDAHVRNVRNGAETTDLFACGRTFAGAHDAQETDAVAGLLWGPRCGRGPGPVGPVEFGDLKRVIEHVLAQVVTLDRVEWRVCGNRPEYHPRECAAVVVGGTTVGYAGRVHPDLGEALEVADDVYAFELDLGWLADRPQERLRARAIPRFPPSQRDVSLLVPEGILAQQIANLIAKTGGSLVERAIVFDEYRGPGVPDGSRALAFRIVYRAGDRTLTDAEVSGVHEQILEALRQRLGVHIRT